MFKVSLARFAENKYNQLLLAMMLAFLGGPLTENASLVSFIIFLIPLLLLVRVIHALQPDRKTFRIYLGLASWTLMLMFLSTLQIVPSQPSMQMIALSRFVILVFLGVPVYLITLEIFRSERVTVDTIKGGICVYFLIGMFWANLYAITEILVPKSFNTSSNLGKIDGLNDLIYFSFTTLTTTGYGDISPGIAFAKVLANFESIIGVMYPTIFIARLIGLYGKQKDQLPT